MEGTLQIMLIIDFSQVVIGSIVVHLKHEANSTNPDGKKLIKHLFLSQLLSYMKKFKDKEVLIACDSKNYWRRDFFPYYKGHRKEGREKSDLDWDFIQRELTAMKEDLIEYFPYKVIEVDGAEADDVIAVVTKHLQTNDLTTVGLFDNEPKPITIISADGDMVQLQKYKNVKQYNSIQKKMVTPKMSLDNFLIEHIVMGDPTDAIPNILSPDNSIVDHVRQKPIKKTYLSYMQDNMRFLEFIEGLDKDTLRNYKRNRTLVDFDLIPDNIYNDIVNEYNNVKVNGNKNKIMNYMIKNQMKHLMDEIGSF
jgi:hypothetical protein